MTNGGEQYAADRLAATAATALSSSISGSQRFLISERPASELERIKDRLYEEAQIILTRRALDRKFLAGPQDEVEYYEEGGAGPAGAGGAAGGSFGGDGEGRRTTTRGADTIGNATTVKTVIEDRRATAEAVTTKIIDDLTKHLDHVREFGQGLFTERRSLDLELADLGQEQTHLGLMQASIQDEREALLKRGGNFWKFDPTLFGTDGGLGGSGEGGRDGTLCGLLCPMAEA